MVVHLDINLLDKDLAILNYYDSAFNLYIDDVCIQIESNFVTIN